MSLIEKSFIDYNLIDLLTLMFCMGLFFLVFYSLTSKIIKERDKNEKM